MSFFLVFLAIVLIGAALFLGSGIARSGRRTGDGLGDPVPNLPPVLLPDNATPADVDRVRFALGLRGYRMDQVDQVLDELKNQLAGRDQEIARLTSLLDEDRRTHHPDGGPKAAGSLQ